MPLTAVTRLLILLLLAAALSGACSPSYNHDTCRELAEKHSRGEELTQDEYSRMIEQYHIVLEYLVQRTDSVMLIGDSAERHSAGARLRADNDFNEHWQVMFDFGSVLYQARAAGKLDDLNLNTYMELLPYTARISSNMAGI